MRADLDTCRRPGRDFGPLIRLDCRRTNFLAQIRQARHIIEYQLQVLISDRPVTERTARLRCHQD